MTNSDSDHFIWVCPVPKCPHMRQAKVHRQVVKEVDDYCPTHGMHLIPLTRAVKDAAKLALNFVFDQSILPPVHLLKYFTQLSPLMCKALTQNWILMNTAIRTSPQMGIYYEAISRTQIKLSNLWFKWTKDRKMTQMLIDQTRAQLQQSQAEFIQSIVAQTAAYVSPPQWQPRFPLDLIPIQHWYREMWPHLMEMIREAQDPNAFELSPERHKAILDLLLTARTANQYLGLPCVYNERQIFDIPELITRYAEFSQTPNLVKRLTSGEFTDFLNQLPLNSANLSQNPSDNAESGQSLLSSCPNSTSFSEINPISSLVLESEPPFLEDWTDQDFRCFTTRVQPATQMVTRKCALKYDPAILASLRHFFTYFNQLKNDITDQIWSRITPAMFQGIGKFSVSRQYADLHINQLRPSFPSELGRPKERLFQVAFAKIYFPIRNAFLHEHNLRQILAYLIFHWTDPTNRNQDDFIAELKIFFGKGSIPRSLQTALRPELAQDCWGKSQFIANHTLLRYCRQLGNYLLPSLEGFQSVGSFLPTTMTQKLTLFTTVSQQFTRNGQILSSVQLLEQFLSQYLRNLKMRTTRLFKLLIQNKPLHSPLTHLIQRWDNPHLQGQARLNYFKQNQTQACRVFKTQISDQLTSSTFDDWMEEEWVIIQNDYSRISWKHALFPHPPRGIIRTLSVESFKNFSLHALGQEFHEILAEFILSQARTPLVLFFRTQFQAWMTSEDPIFRIKPKFSKSTIALSTIQNLWKAILPAASQDQIKFVFSPFVRDEGWTFFLSSSKLQSLFTVPNGGALPSVQEILKKPPQLLLNDRQLLLAQTLEITQRPSRSTQFEMAVDLGLKTLATVVIRDIENNHEVGRRFIRVSDLFRGKFNSTTGKLDPILDQMNHPIQPNIPRKLDHINTHIRKMQGITKSLEVRNRTACARYRFHLNRLNQLRQKQRHLHDSIVNQLGHRLTQIAKFFNVSVIKFEDLRWSHHSSKQQVGFWLTTKQQQWFFSQIQQRTASLAIREGIRSGWVNAQWSSQICAHHGSRVNQNFSAYMSREEMEQAGVLGIRRGKRFFCNCINCNNHWKGDSDLNAARNLIMRPIQEDLT